MKRFSGLESSTRCNQDLGFAERDSFWWLFPFLYAGKGDASGDASGRGNQRLLASGLSAGSRAISLSRCYLN